VTLFRRSNDVEVSISAEFDKEYKPDETPLHTGIYRCRGCGCEIVAEANKPFPPEKHPRHSPAATGGRGAARTALVVLPAPYVVRCVGKGETGVDGIKRNLVSQV